MNIFSIMPDFLRDPDTFFKEIQEGKDVKAKVLTLGLASILFFTAYGFMVGLSKSPVQALSSAVKMPILFLVTMAFCLPALYFFSLALLGTPLKIIQVLAVVLAGMGVTSFLLLGLAPITLFFVLTSANYAFFQLLAVAFTGLSAWIGVYFLWRGMTLVDTARDHSTRRLGQRILTLWILLYGFVGTQMTWRLSPFIGKPEDPFYLVKPSRDNFYVDVIHALQASLQIPASEVTWVAPLITASLCVLTVGALVFVGGLFIGTNFRKKPVHEQAATN
jgi:hypothetical protein